MEIAPREMLLEKGPGALSDAMLPAILTVEDTPPCVFNKLTQNRYLCFNIINYNLYDPVHSVNS